MTEESKPKKARAVKATPSLRPALPQKEDGSTDWRKIVSPQNVILNPHFYARIGIDSESLEESEKDRLKSEAPDEGLIILLAGFREIAKRRGVSKTIFKLCERQDHRAVVSVEITLVPTVDEPYETVISGLANCSVDNCSPNFFKYAEALASNRAECRALRQALNIASVSFEELDPNDKPEIKTVPNAVNLLIKAMEENGYQATDIPKLMEAGGYTLSSKWSGTIESMENPEIFTVVGIIERNKKK
jgi:hypothetical protein